ncbi:HAD family hydrolase, partial [Staphylococcus epidermidis]
QIFQHLFISQKPPFQNPITHFFHFVFQHIPHNNTNQTLILPHSLTSHILPPKNPNISTSSFNITQKQNHTSIQPHYIINHLSQIIPILHSIQHINTIQQL